jgi:two-component system, cell cycle sensor histidine kinase and response regulator CckA
MKSPLRILHLEANPNDSERARTALAEGGIVCSMRRVDSRTDFLTALASGEVDLVLSDFAPSGFNGNEAVEIVRENWPDVPCILVSKTLAEEPAAQSLHIRATDYVQKRRILQLASRVRRALEEAEQRREHQRLELQIIQSQKTQIFGQLAVGIAHDFNNILALIMGHGDLLQEEFGADSRLRDYIEPIRDAAQRGAGLTRQLLVLSRKQTVQPVVVDINILLNAMEKLLRRLIDESIELNIIPENNIGRIRADEGYVWQVLMNLVVNARDAMPNGGKLIIATRNITLGKNYVRSHAGVTPGHYVMLSVSDTGTGMTKEVKARLFEAFFTTKPEGKGTGLGLATCQTIAKQCGGHIGVFTEIEKGSTFKVFFPRIDEPLEISPDSASGAPLTRGTETLLVVEDEPTVRQLARTVLEAQGYTILSASNGQDALNTVRKHQGPPISLVVTDVVMPQMGGKPMADLLTKMYPGLKILFTSGYADEAIAHHGVLEPGIDFLAKPYTPLTLSRRVREMLDRDTLNCPEPSLRPGKLREEIQ